MLGLTLPLPVAVVAIPVLVRTLGTDRFGVLTLAWALIGYFSLFDFGLGRALTKVVAERLGLNRLDDVSPVVWTGMWMVIALGLIAAGLVAVLTPHAVERILRIPGPLQGETRGAFFILAGTIPFVTGYAGMRGVLEAWNRFDLTNAIRIPMGVLMFAAPLLVLPFSHKLPAVVASLASVRIAAALLQCVLTLRYVPYHESPWTPRLTHARELLQFGSWMTVSNVVSPLMVTLDRFLIGSMVSVAAVAFYATPYEAITKLLLLPAALVGVLFPAFASAAAADITRTSRLFRRGVKVLLIALFPLSLLVVAFAHDILRLWLGPEFADHSTIVLQILAIGVFVNGLANVPFALIQGAGRPDLTAKVHLIELPLYLIALWVLVSRFGIVGAAIAWSARSSIDSLVLFIIVDHYFVKSAERLAPLAVGLVILLVATTTIVAPLSLPWRGPTAALIVVSFGAVVPSFVLRGEDKAVLSDAMASLRRLLRI